jgi:hypothetical protein
MELLKYVQEIEENIITIPNDYGLDPSRIRSGISIYGTGGSIVGTMSNIDYQPSEDISGLINTNLSGSISLANTYVPGETMTGRLEVPAFDDRIMLSDGMSSAFTAATALRMAPSVSEEILEAIQNTIREAIIEEFRSIRVSPSDTVTYTYTPPNHMEYMTTRIDLRAEPETSALDEPPTEDE